MLIGSFELFLLQQGFKLASRTGPTGQPFGNAEVAYSGSGMMVTIVKDRGQLEVYVRDWWPWPLPGYTAAEIRSLIEKQSVEALGGAAAAGFVQDNWQKIKELFSRASRRTTRKSLKLIRKKQELEWREETVHRARKSLGQLWHEDDAK